MDMMNAEVDTTVCETGVTSDQRKEIVALRTFPVRKLECNISTDRGGSNNIVGLL